MDELLPVINKLQSIFSITGSCHDIIQLPQIVVVGSQSSGKSSVLESIVGRDFLPRGTGIVTRRPLMLHLIHVTEEEVNARRQNDSSTDDNDEEWAIFDHCKDKVFYDFNLVREEIIRETDRESGTNKGISDKAIGLKIYSNKVVNLSLIDLPGITKVAVGDQPEDIEDQISNLILRYISNPNAIILAVTPANQDFANSDAIKFARNVDRDGKRTIAVLTKLDLMDSGTDASDVLMGKVVPIKLGIVGVVNRSQRDIDSNKSVKESLKDEMEFLQRRYPTLVQKSGTNYLSKLLNKLLLTHIKKNLPQLKDKVTRLTQQFQAEVNLIGEPTIDKGQTLLNIITKFTSSYNAVIDGTSKNIETQELCGGARISYIFHETFSKALFVINPTKQYTEMDILTAMRNSRGLKTSLYIPEECFELLVKQQIKRLEEPSLHCVDLIHEELIRLLQNCGTEFQQEMYRFPVLGENINMLLRNLLKSKLEPTKKFITDLINIQIAYINTNSAHFEAVYKKLENNKMKETTKDKHSRLGTKIVERGSTFGSSNSQNIIQPQPSYEGLSKRTYKDLCKKRSDPKALEGITSWFFGNQVSGESNNKNDSITTVIPDDVPLVEATSIASETCDMATAPCMTPRKNTNNGYEEYDNDNHKKVSKLSSKEKEECEIILKLTQEYFNITRQQIMDLVPKSIMNFLVNDVKLNLHNELVRNLYDKAKFDSLLTENEEIDNRRKHCFTTLEALKKAVVVLSEVKETIIF
uniref:dynamin GTPase n=1 Tax=Parastrongyloides trichosuri TaxID=131310 RepID=A0A0N4Z751_PARTI